MKECILGISSFGHDTSACLVNASNGDVIFASAQERYSNIKYDDTIPLYTINECLKIAKKLNFQIIKATISCNYKLFLGNYLFNRIYEIVIDKKLSIEIFNLLKNNLESSDYYSRFNLTKNFLDIFISNNKEKLSIKKINDLKKIITWYFNWSIKHKKIENLLQKFIGKIDLVPINHHLSHAASAYFNSGFDEANILVMDGQGEEETITIYDASNKNLSLISRTAWPNSLGIFYLEGTKVLGYSLGDEYKVMGMSAYGKPIYQKALETSFDINNNGELAITESDYLGFCEIKDTGHRSIYFKEKLKNKFKITKDNNFEQNHFDFASSLQSTVENTGIGLSEWAFEKTKKNKICLSGGVALNGLMNNKILNSNNFSDAFVYPASGDDGTSVGSALYYLSQNKDFNFFNKKISTCFYGFKNKLNLERDRKILKDLNIERSEHIQKFVASKLSKNFVVAIYDSNLGSEFGPRSLGGRSILANPANPKMKEILNKKIKLREPFRPFAPICLKDNVADFFEIKCESSFMLFICETKKEKKHLIPSVVHEDDTARVQSVSEENGNLYKILKEFNTITKVPILINTSFNIGGEAIVNTVEDAILSFKKMDIDYLVIDNYIISKKDKFIPNNMDTKKFIENRKSRFKENNNFPSINISYYNSNFYNSFYSYLKRKIIENIINKKYI